MFYAISTRDRTDLQLERVVRSFQGMATAMPVFRVPGCQQRLTCQVAEDEAGAQVRLQTADDRAAAVLRIRRSGVTLRAVSRAQPGSDVVSVIEDEFSVHLDDELRWGDVVFRSPDVLAARLLEHAARRLALLAEERPRRSVATGAPAWTVLLPGAAPPGSPPAGRRVYGWTRGMPSTRTTMPLRPPRMRDG
jgi:hypothetical protein